MFHFSFQINNFANVNVFPNGRHSVDGVSNSVVITTSTILEHMSHYQLGLGVRIAVIIFEKNVSTYKIT